MHASLYHLNSVMSVEEYKLATAIPGRPVRHLVGVFAVACSPSDGSYEMMAVGGALSYRLTPVNACSSVE